MNLLGIWVVFIISVSIFQELNLLDYLLLNLLILLFIYIYNLIKPSQIFPGVTVLLWSLPNFIILYIMFIYGSFLLVATLTSYCLRYIHYL